MNKKIEDLIFIESALDELFAVARSAGAESGAVNNYVIAKEKISWLRGGEASAETRKAAVTTAPKSLDGFVDWMETWDSDKPIFKSKLAAQWFMRSRRVKLMEAKAICKIRGVLHLHPERLKLVMERDCFDRECSRVAGKIMVRPLESFFAP